MVKKDRTIGIKVKMPSKQCNDKKCPFHGNLNIRGRTFTGVIIKKDVHKTATVEWNRKIKIPKYERYEKKRTKIHVHNPPCIDAKEGNKVMIAECKPISKTKNFVIIEDLGKQFGFEQIEEAREEAKHTDKVSEMQSTSDDVLGMKHSQDARKTGFSDTQKSKVSDKKEDIEQKEEKIDESS